jgi:hypothetical protein
MGTHTNTHREICRGNLNNINISIDMLEAKRDHLSRLDPCIVRLSRIVTKSCSKSGTSAISKIWSDTSRSRTTCDHSAHANNRWRLG